MMTLLQSRHIGFFLRVLVIDQVLHALWFLNCKYTPMFKNLAVTLRNGAKSIAHKQANAAFIRTMATTREVTIREALREAMDEEMGTSI
jgi:hypothetical protein